MVDACAGTGYRSASRSPDHNRLAPIAPKAAANAPSSQRENRAYARDDEFADIANEAVGGADAPSPEGLPDGFDLADVELLGPLSVGADPSCLPVNKALVVRAEVNYLTEELDSGTVDVSALVTIEAGPGHAFEIVSQGDGAVSARLVAPNIALITARRFDGREDGIVAVTAFSPETPRPAVLVDRGNSGCAISGLSSDGSCATAIMSGCSGGTVAVGDSALTSAVGTQTIGADGATVRFDNCEVIENPADLPVIELGG